MKRSAVLLLCGITVLAGILHSCREDDGPVPPTITTAAVSSITTTTATSGGNIIDDGGREITARGVVWAENEIPDYHYYFEYGIYASTTDGWGAGSFTSRLTQLTPGSYYYVRAYATTSVGTFFAPYVQFRALGESPWVTDLAATNITATSATLSGSVNPNHLSTDVIFEYGTTLSLESTAPATPSPVTGDTVTKVSADIAGLKEGTTYHYTIRADNAYGGTFPPCSTFTTLPSENTVTDIDGNIYNTVTIGTQTWMVENLKTTRYSNGELIGTTTPATLDLAEEEEIAPKYQWAYDGNESNVNTYGRLYSWFAITDERNICPTGWIVPRDKDWTTLSTYLGGEIVAGGKLKEAGTMHWATPNTGANNETGFTALPGGFRNYDGNFYFIGNIGYWWSKTENSTEIAWYRHMNHDNSSVNRHTSFKYNGFSVRCLQDY